MKTVILNNSVFTLIMEKFEKLKKKEWIIKTIWEKKTAILSLFSAKHAV